MKNINPEREKQIITTVLSNTTDEEQVALSNWAAQLLAIRNSSYSNVTKGKEAIRITAQSRIVVPILKVIAKELKLDQFDVSKIDTSSYKQALKSIRKFWKNRSLPVKLFVGAGTLAAIIFGSQGAGIAALGSAIGLPLWVVFGAGASFIGVLYEEINGKAPDTSASYTIIDAVERDGVNAFTKLRHLVSRKLKNSKDK